MYTKTLPSFCAGADKTKPPVGISTSSVNQNQMYHTRCYLAVIFCLVSGSIWLIIALFSPPLLFFFSSLSHFPIKWDFQNIHESWFTIKVKINQRSCRYWQNQLSHWQVKKQTKKRGKNVQNRKIHGVL